MPSLVEYLRRDVIGRAAGSIPALSGRLHSGGQPKISQFNFHLVVEKDIAEFDIAVDNAISVQVLERIDDLQQVVLGLDLRDPDPAPEEL